MSNTASVLRIAFGVFVFALVAVGSPAHGEPSRYITWTGIGPDKWASAWLIHRHIDPGATIRFVDVGTVPDSGVAFDIPDVPPYFRDRERTTYESLLDGYGIDDESLRKIGAVVYDIEVNFWGGDQSPMAPFLEQAFRGLQFKYGRENVPRACYFQLFDALYSYVQARSSSPVGTALQRALTHDPRCGSVSKLTVVEDRKYVEEWRPAEILRFIDAGDKVIFVDTRESDEFEEGHIPGAINLKLRDIGDRLPPELEGADVVVPYCVKDFRGFEVAKRLKKLGAQTVGLMNPYGLSGWSATGLPVVGTRGLQEQEGSERLRECVGQPSRCINDG